MIRDRRDFYFFWKGPFSQWARFDMEVDGLTYCTCEQYMMAEKARLFWDVRNYSRIMKTEDPKRQKALGREVRNFEEEKWKKVAREIVFKGNYAKFSQHPELRKKLIATGDKILAEASPHDCIWGIGWAVTDPEAVDMEQWKGTNWLGQVLMRVRDKLREEDEEKDQPM